MNAACRKKVRDVKRKSGKKRRRQVMMRRACAVIILVLIVILIISGIRGCSGSKKNNSPVVTVVPAVTAAPASSPEPVGNVTESDISQSFFDSSCFVGNSVIESMEIYELVNDADYFARIGLNVSDASKLAMDNSNIPVIDELNNSKKYKRIFMMFGENELNWPSVDTFKTDYSTLIKKAKRYQPSAEIYLFAVTPITKQADSEQKEGVTTDAILRFNKIIQEVAKSNGVKYVDLYAALADKDGFLPAGAATDGIHFDKDYYIKCLVYTQNNG